MSAGRCMIEQRDGRRGRRPVDDREIIGLLLERDPQGLDRLLLRHGPLLRYIIWPILADPREREECLSDVAMLVWDKIGLYQAERGSFPAWLSALARNTARNRLRAGGRQLRTPEQLSPAMPDPAPGPEEAVLSRERARLLQQAIDRLGAGERRLFYRKYYYLQPTAQMAAELGLSERAVEGRLRRLRLKLRRELGGEQDG